MAEKYWLDYECPLEACEAGLEVRRTLQKKLEPHQFPTMLCPVCAEGEVRTPMVPLSCWPALHGNRASGPGHEPEPEDFSRQARFIGCDGEEMKTPGNLSARELKIKAGLDGAWAKGLAAARFYTSLRWLEMPSPRRGRSNKERLAELVCVNRGEWEPRRFTDRPLILVGSPYGRLGLTVEEAMELAFLAGELEMWRWAEGGYYVGQITLRVLAEIQRAKDEADERASRKGKKI